MRSLHRLRFQGKVLIPVVTIMVLLSGLTAWVVNRRFSQQLRTEAAQSLSTASAIFEYSQQLRKRHLLDRYQTLVDEPRIKSISQLDDPATAQGVLEKDLLPELQWDFALLTKRKTASRLARAARPSAIDLDALEAACIPSIRSALGGESDVDSVRVGSRLYEVVSIPVTVGGDIVTILTVAEEIGQRIANELKQLTHSEIIFLADEQVAASTLRNPERYPQLVQIFQQFSPEGRPAGSASPAHLRDLVVGGEHFLVLPGYFSPRHPDIGYLLLSSYEEALHQLHSTQRMLFGLSLGGVLLSAIITWLVIRTITQPLRLLRDGAEAVGQGDFSRRVSVTSDDECGDLAKTFNQMTENLKTSRQQLEATVETLKTTRAQLSQSEKLSAVGEFVAGITHELNNPLASVIGFGELLKQCDLDDRHREYIDYIYLGAQRCRKIVQSLLSFARQHPPERKLVNVNDLLDSTVKFLQYQLRTSNIEVVFDLDRCLPPVMADGHQLQQLFLNIINNARQAMEATQPEGLLRITTEPRPGKVRITFQDNGPGIPVEHLTKIFDPFFTTKEVGQGTGLGLSLCYGIVQEHGGTITVQSPPGEGARFILELPVGHGTATSDTRRVERVVEPVDPLRPKRKVLVIDDEESILLLIRETLSRDGYQIDTAADGQAGLDKIAVGSYDVIVCDWKMPGLNGQQVYEKLYARNPQAAGRIIFMTGDVMSPKTQAFLREHGKVCLAKPFSLDEFRQAVRSQMKPS